MNKYILLLSLFIITNTLNIVQASHLSGPENYLCKHMPIGWKDNKNTIEAGYEYCIRSNRANVKFTNLTQDSIFISSKIGHIFEIEPESVSQLLPYSRQGVFHFVTKTQGRVYMMGNNNNIIVSPYLTRDITKDVYSRVKNNLQTSSMKKVPMFRVRDISYENPIFIDNPDFNFVEKQTFAFPAIVVIGVGGGIAGAINAWDPNGFCGPDVVRGAIVGAITGLGASMLAIPSGGGIIIGATAGAALNKSLSGACLSCYTSGNSYCGERR